MAFFILKDEDNWYRIIKKGSINIDLLAYFLTADVSSCAQDFIPDFEDSEDHCAAMNATQYIKLDGIVTITPEWVIDQDESIAKGNFFQIKSDILAQLLRQWDVIYKQKPPYITVVVNDNSAEVTGSKTHPECH